MRDRYQDASFAKSGWAYYGRPGDVFCNVYQNEYFVFETDPFWYLGDIEAIDMEYT